MIGFGTHGEVYSDVHGETVVKRVPMLYENSPNGSMIGELIALERLSRGKCTNIVDYHGYTVDFGAKAISIKLEALEPLGCPARRNLDWRISIVRDALTALKGMHNLNVFHLDIKPGNMMLKGNTLKLIDFGLALTDDVKTTREVYGVYTKQYRPPELMLGFKNYDMIKSDVWAMGISAFELMSGVDDRVCSNTLMPPTTPNILETYVEALPKTRDFIDLHRIKDPNARSMWEHLMPAPAIMESVYGPDGSSFLEDACKADPNVRPSPIRLLRHPLINGEIAPESSWDNVPWHLIKAPTYPSDNAIRSYYDHQWPSPLLDARAHRWMEVINADPGDRQIYKCAVSLLSMYAEEFPQPSSFHLETTLQMLANPRTPSFLCERLIVI